MSPQANQQVCSARKHHPREEPRFHHNAPRCTCSTVYHDKAISQMFNPSLQIKTSSNQRKPPNNKPCMISACSIQWSHFKSHLGVRRSTIPDQITSSASSSPTISKDKSKTSLQTLSTSFCAVSKCLDRSQNLQLKSISPSPNFSFRDH